MSYCHNMSKLVLWPFLRCHYCKVDNPCLFNVLDQTLYLSGMWLGVAPRKDTKKTCVQKKLDYVLKM